MIPLHANHVIAGRGELTMRRWRPCACACCSAGPSCGCSPRFLVIRVAVVNSDVIKVKCLWPRVSNPTAAAVVQQIPPTTSAVTPATTVPVLVHVPVPVLVPFLVASAAQGVAVGAVVVAVWPLGIKLDVSAVGPTSAASRCMGEKRIRIFFMFIIAIVVAAGRVVQCTISRRLSAKAIWGLGFDVRRRTKCPLDASASLLVCV